MKKISKTPVATTETPVFPQTMHRVRPHLDEKTQMQGPEKRDNTFSQSRDVREDRGRREMKTTHNAQTFPHAH